MLVGHLFKAAGRCVCAIDWEPVPAHVYGNVWLIDVFF